MRVNQNALGRLCVRAWLSACMDVSFLFGGDKTPRANDQEGSPPGNPLHTEQENGAVAWLGLAY